MKHGRKSSRARPSRLPNRPTPTTAAPDHLLWFPARDWGLGALLLLLTLAAYWPALQGGVLWDDDSHITRDTLRSWTGLIRIWTELGATQQYYPLLHTAFWIEHRLWGDAVVGYHLVNLLEHVTSAFFVVALSRRLKIAGGWIAAFIFALHPVCVESVAWMSEQKNTLSTVLYLAAGWTYLDFDENRDRRRYGSAALLFVLALLSKTVTATLPAALLVLIWWRRGRIEIRRDLAPLLPWLVVGVAAGFFSSWVERVYIGAQGSAYMLTLAQRGLVATRAVCFYAGKLVWPANLNFIYPHWTIDPGAAWQYIFPVIVAGLLLALLAAARFRRGPLAAGLIFGGTLFPALGFVNVFPFQYSYVADHFQYAACLALIVPAAWALTLIGPRLPASARTYVAAGIAGIPVILAILTFQQARIYQSATVLYESAIAGNPDCWLAHNNLANILAQSPDTLPEAIPHLETAIRLKPDGYFAQNNLANDLVRLDRVPEAIPHYEAALRTEPNYARAHKDLGTTLMRTPDGITGAIAHFEAALKLNPNDEEAHNDLGTALVRLPDQTEQAVLHFRAAIRIAPGFVQAHNNLGAALVRIPGQFSEAKAQVEEALRLDPNYAIGHYTLGLMLIKESRLAEARAELEKAVELKPDYVEARERLSRFHR